MGCELSIRGTYPAKYFFFSEVRLFAPSYCRSAYLAYFAPLPRTHSLDAYQGPSFCQSQASWYPWEFDNVVLSLPWNIQALVVRAASPRARSLLPPAVRYRYQIAIPSSQGYLRKGWTSQVPTRWLSEGSDPGTSYRRVRSLNHRAGPDK